MSTVLVTGGAGFIGSHLCEALLARGERVVAFDDLSTGVRDDVPDGVELVVGDAADSDVTRDVFARFRPEVVFHVAGQASIFRSFERPEADLRTNVVGTLNVLECCVEQDVSRLVFASSMTVYGEPEQVPTPESALCVPRSFYGVTKYAAERYAQISVDRGLAVTSLRMFNVYGERQSLSNPYQGVLAIFIGNVLRGEPITIHSDGRQTRDFVYVGDVVDAWLRVLDAPETVGRVFNVGSGRETAIAELASAVARACGHDSWELKAGPAQEGDVRRSAGDVSALSAVTGWQPRTSLDQGLRRTVEWARAS